MELLDAGKESRLEMIVKSSGNSLANQKPTICYKYSEKSTPEISQPAMMV